MDLPVSHVFRRDDARKIDGTALRGLVSSIQEIGIINPLRVRPVKRIVNGEEADAYEVTAGNHRLQAALKIGLETVPCIVVDEDDLHAELAMCDENLCRNLPPAEEARLTVRRKEIYLLLHPETRQHVAGAHASNKAQGNASANLAPAFTEATAEVVGRSERSVQRSVERGEKIAPDVLARISGTHLDTGVYLDALKKLSPDEQRSKIDRALAAPKVSKVTRLAKEPLNDFEAKEKQVSRLMDAWNAASPEAREEFLGRIDRPVMDQRYGT